MLYNIVDYLKAFDIFPEASASSQQDGYPASNALIYDKQNSFWSHPNQRTPQWWTVDFKQKVIIRKYQILAEIAYSSNSWLYNWTLSIMNDKNTWQRIHGPIQDSNANKTYDLSKSYKTRYARIDGDTLFGQNTKKISFYYAKFFGETQLYRIECTCKKTRRMSTLLILVNVAFCK